MRTVRCRNDQQPGTLGRLLIRVSEAGGDVGSIRLIQETHLATIRDLTIYADDEAQLERVLAAMAANPGTRILAVRDEVLELHEEGKIAADPGLARMYTAISHLVAIVTDGSAVLGLGDIGPHAGMPVMEGKAMLMETLVGLGAAGNAIGRMLIHLNGNPVLGADLSREALDRFAAQGGRPASWQRSWQRPTSSSPRPAHPA